MIGRHAEVEIIVIVCYIYDDTLNIVETNSKQRHISPNEMVFLFNEHACHMYCAYSLISRGIRITLVEFSLLIVVLLFYR